MHRGVRRVTFPQFHFLSSVKFLVAEGLFMPSSSRRRWHFKLVWRPIDTIYACPQVFNRFRTILHSYSTDVSCVIQLCRGLPYTFLTPTSVGDSWGIIPPCNNLRRLIGTFTFLARDREELIPGRLVMDGLISCVRRVNGHIAARERSSPVQRGEAR